MKGRHFTKCLTIFLVLAITFLATPFFFAPQSALAEDFTPEIRQDENFSLSMDVTARQNVALPLVTKQDETGKVTYLCFQWRDLKRLNFHITALNKNLNEGRYAFKVTHTAREDLTALIDSTPRILYEGDIGDFVLLDLYFNIDSVLGEELSPRNFVGNDYGLYKFDFVYSRSVDGQLKDIALGESIHIAVLPDKNIKEIMTNNNIQIVHSVSSSNRLINIFNLTFNSDALKYVRPDLITWIAYGKDKENAEFCMTEEMKALDLDLSNCSVIWENYPNMNGTNFVLDTKEIEGTWRAYAIVKDYDGEEFRIPQTEELSTIKVPPKNNVWLILMIVGIVLLILFLVAILILYIMRKREKVW